MKLLTTYMKRQLENIKIIMEVATAESSQTRVIREEIETIKS